MQQVFFFAKISACALNLQPPVQRKQDTGRSTCHYYFHLLSSYGSEIIAVSCDADHLQATCTRLQTGGVGRSVGVLTKRVVNVTIGQLLFVYDFPLGAILSVLETPEGLCGLDKTQPPSADK